MSVRCDFYPPSFYGSSFERLSKTKVNSRILTEVPGWVEAGNGGETDVEDGERREYDRRNRCDRQKPYTVRMRTESQKRDEQRSTSTCRTRDWRNSKNEFSVTPKKGLVDKSYRRIWG